MTKPASRNNLSDPYVKTSLVPRFSIDRESFGVVSERFARYLGTSTFIMQMTLFLIGWFLWNTLAPANLRFDKYPFQFMTLLLSLQASYAAPLILLAQNRQDDRDRVSMEEDRSRANQTKEDTEYLARELAALRMKVGDVATRDYLRGEIDRLRSDVSDLTTALREAGAIGAAPSPAKGSRPKTKPKKEKQDKEPIG